MAKADPDSAVSRVEEAVAILCQEGDGVSCQLKFDDLGFQCPSMMLLVFGGIPPVGWSF
jgi:hypothetical protein